VSEKLLTEVAEEVFSYLSEDFEVNVKFACENCVRKLNKQYRGKDEPTNVLSFNIDPESKEGDILICESVVAKEATELKHAPKDLDLLYLVHGMLHLAGFDHTNDTERVKMETVEEEILSKVGISISR
jgi:probable rRNA maturation factor